MEYSKSEIEKRRAERRRRIRKARIKRACLFLSAVVVLTGSIIGVKRLIAYSGIASKTDNLSKSNSSKSSISAKNITVPDYVDVQLIPKGEARKGKKLDKVKYIVIHYVGNPATSAQNNRDYFAKSDTQVCSHFVIGLNGEIIQCVPLDERSAASNERNKDSISIEVCHPDKSGKFNDVTYESLVKLTSWLCKEFNINEDDVIRHYDVTGKLCPLYYVNNPEEWNTFRNEIKNNLQGEK